jgi:hypothetical protein
MPMFTAFDRTAATAPPSSRPRLRLVRLASLAVSPHDMPAHSTARPVHSRDRRSSTRGPVHDERMR